MNDKLFSVLVPYDKTARLTSSKNLFRPFGRRRFFGWLTNNEQMTPQAEFDWLLSFWDEVALEKAIAESPNQAKALTQQPQTIQIPVLEAAPKSQPTKSVAANAKAMIPPLEAPQNSLQCRREMSRSIELDSQEFTGALTSTLH